MLILDDGKNASKFHVLLYYITILQLMNGYVLQIWFVIFCPFLMTAEVDI